MATVGLSRIYTSPLGRAQHTAQYTADATGIEPVILPWTAELSIDGVTGIDGAKWAAWNLEGQIIRGDQELPHHGNWHEQAELSHYNYREHYDKLKNDSDAFLDELGYHRPESLQKLPTDPQLPFPPQNAARARPSANLMAV
jgi:probable phosphoglycerate mutase